MWFLVAISIGAYSSGTGYRFNQVNQVSLHASKAECQTAADGVRQQLKDFSDANGTTNTVRLICVQGGQQ